MCCFSRPVRSVNTTCIFARAEPGGREALAYAMRYEADEPLALVLPLPVPDGCPDNAVTWIDLSGCPRFFNALGYAFGDPRPEVSRSGTAAGATLEVVRVGSFEASFVPSVADLSRLDPRFTLPTSVVNALPGFNTCGFVIARLHPDATAMHPLACTYPRRDPGRIFFPTLHVHAGKVTRTARFDHWLYLQAPDGSAAANGKPGLLEKLIGPTSPGGDWTVTTEPAGKRIDCVRTQGLVRPDWPLARLRIKGTFLNQDVIF